MGDDSPLVLVVNSGSSSVKFALVDPATGQRPVSALAERVGSSDAVVHVTRSDTTEDSSPNDSTPDAIVAHLLESITDGERSRLVGVGHRVVHGGRRFTSAVTIDDDVVAALQELVELAPLHMPANIAGVQAARSVLPDLPQVAVFDTAFHHTMPPHAYRYAVPTAWYEEHDVRRYGFHGTSHRYVSTRAAQLLGRPLASLGLITVHLGNGCSAAAVSNGVSVDTTMGLTPLEGLVMGTRSGDLDPGVLGYIGKRLGLDLAALLEVLNTRSGLRGLSGLSNDMRTLTDAAADGSAPAQLAIDVFCYRVAKAIAALTVALQQLDAVVFTGGIGERGDDVRSCILAQLGFLGLAEDPAANAEHGRATQGRITLPGATAALVVPTDEELVIARDTIELAR